jgi:curli biogenesis system outer membrane secretion channel CsgG
MHPFAAQVCAQGDYVAYSIIKENEERPLPKSLKKVPAKHLINVRWGAYDGPKTRIGVLEVENKSNVSSFTISGPGGQTYSYSVSDFTTQVPVNGIEAMITDSLHRTGRFRLVERKVLGDVLGEQDLAASGRVSKPSGAKTGKVLGAETLIQGVVTSYEPKYKGKKVGLGGLTGGIPGGALLGGASVGTEKSMVSMNFRLIDAETSEVLYTKQVDAVVGKTAFGLGGGGWGSGGALGGFLSSYSKTPIGQAVMAAVNMGVFELIQQIGNSPAEGSVVKVSGSKVYVNLGEDVVDTGLVLKAVSKGEELIDPETGISLGGEEEEIGRLKVTEVKEKYCVATPVKFDASRLKTGDKVVSTKKAAPLRYASSW